MDDLIELMVKIFVKMWVWGFKLCWYLIVYPIKLVRKGIDSMRAKAVLSSASALDSKDEE